MRTAHVSDIRSSMRDNHEEEDPDWLPTNLENASRQEFNPHVLEHEARAAELLDEDDEDAALIHQLLGKNIKRVARKKD